jgi:DNA-binding phage protein
MGVERGSVFRWYHDKRDPTADTVVEIVEALKRINHKAAEEFVQLYLGDMLADQD